VYQNLDVALFGPLKAAFVKERDTFERRNGYAPTKAVFLAVYAAAHAQVLTPLNIQSAMKKSGTWPVNRGAVSESMLAPSLEALWSAHMPLLQPTPVRAVAQLLRATNNIRYGQQSSPPSSPTPKSHTRVSKETTETTLVAQPTASVANSKGQQGTSERVNRSQKPADAPQTWEKLHVAAANEPASVVSTAEVPVPAPAPETPCTTLRSTPAAFLVDNSLITSTMDVPQAQRLIRPRWEVPHEWAEYSPDTAAEAMLLALLNAANSTIKAERDALLEAHATMVIQNIYVERVKGQLAAHEAKEREKHSGSRGKRLLSDGMPHTLTGEDFMGAVMAHHQAAQAEVEARKVQATAKAVHEAAVTEWETLEAARKQRNKKLTLDHKAQHAAWVASKQLTKDEG